MDKKKAARRRLLEDWVWEIWIKPQPDAPYDADCE